MDIFNNKYIWVLYNQMMSLGKGKMEIPNTNFRIVEVEPYHVVVQLEKLYNTKNGDVKAKWIDTPEEYKINVLNSKEWDAMFN